VAHKCIKQKREKRENSQVYEFWCDEKVRVVHSLYNARTKVATKMEGRYHLTVLESTT